MRLGACLFAIFSLALALSTAAQAPNLSAGYPAPAAQTIGRGYNATVSANGVSGGVPPYSYTWYEKTPNLSKFVLATDCKAPKSQTCAFTALPSVNTGTYSFMLQVTDEAAPVSDVANSTVAFVYVTMYPPSSTTAQQAGGSNYTSTNSTVQTTLAPTTVRLNQTQINEENTQQDYSTIGLIVVLIVIAAIYLWHREGMKPRRKA